MSERIQLIINPLVNKLVGISGKIDPDAKQRIETLLKDLDRNESWFVRTACMKMLGDLEREASVEMKETAPTYRTKRKKH